MDCDPQTLVNDARCFQQCDVGAMFDAIEIVLLCAIRDGGASMACDPQTLMNQANCILCTVPVGMFAAIKISLLCQIATGTGGGGLGGVTCGTTDPVAAPTGTCALYYRTDNGSLWKWNGAAWGALLGP
jgi:hypothetical protein